MIRLLSRAINGIYALIIILLLVYLGFRLSNKIEIYNVETGSMEDNIHRGDYILVYKTDSYAVGDVVTFMVGEYFVTHRIIKIDGDEITTKGDANNIEDGKIDRSVIIGKVSIAGGILNVLIEYKFAIVAFLLALYLFSCYFNDGKKKEIEESNEENAEMAELEEPEEPKDEVKADEEQTIDVEDKSEEQEKESEVKEDNSEEKNDESNDEKFKDKLGENSEEITEEKIDSENNNSDVKTEE